MSLGSRFFAAMYDRMSRGSEAAGLQAHREALLAGVSGRVVEIGAGTGRNLAFYGDDVDSLTITEPDPHMARKLEQRIEEHPRPVELVRAPAEELPFEDGEFDVAVSTLVLCGVEDQAARARRGSPRAEARRRAAVHRARPLRRSRPRPQAGPDQRPEPDRRALQLQPLDARRDPRGRLHDHEAASATSCRRRRSSSARSWSARPRRAESGPSPMAA